MLAPTHLNAQQGDVFAQIVTALKCANIPPQVYDVSVIETLVECVVQIRRAHIEARLIDSRTAARAIASEARMGALSIAKSLGLPRESLGRLLWVH